MTDEVKVTEGQPVAPEEAAELKKLAKLPVVTKVGLKAPVKVVKPPVVQPKPTATPQPKPTAEAAKVEGTDNNLLAELVKQLPQGKTLTFSRIGADSWAVTAGVPTAATFGGGKVKKAKAADNPMYTAFMNSDCGSDAEDFKGKGWRALTLEQQYAFAEAVNAQWEHHDNAQIDRMRMTMAVTTALGIPKSLPAAETPAE